MYDIMGIIQLKDILDDQCECLDDLAIKIQTICCIYGYTSTQVKLTLQMER